MRRDFQLPEQDVEFLNALARPWETVLDGKGRWLLMNVWPVPPGYNVGCAMAAVRIEQGYPDTEIDMVYFFPHLSRKDSVAIGALANHQLQGKTWQRWSRHRTTENPWRVGVDDLMCHMTLVDHWLIREFQKKAA